MKTSVINCIFKIFNESLSNFKQLSRVNVTVDRDSDSLSVRHKCLQGYKVLGYDSHKRKEKEKIEASQGLAPERDIQNRLSLKENLRDRKGRQ